MKYTKVSTNLEFDGSNYYVNIQRGYWVAMKIRLDETHDLANALVDLTEKVTANE